MRWWASRPDRVAHRRRGADPRRRRVRPHAGGRGARRAPGAHAGAPRPGRAPARADRRRARARVQEELDRLAEGLSGSPEQSSWRAQVSGPALWELVDFGERLTARQRDGLEAALDASGPSTGVPVRPARACRPRMARVLLTGGGEVSGRTLDDVLIVDPAAVGVDVETLRAVLAGVAVVERDAGPKRGAVVLGLDGSCALGPIRARREVRPAAWVDATARERGRLAPRPSSSSARRSWRARAGRSSGRWTRWTRRRRGPRSRPARCCAATGSSRRRAAVATPPRWRWRSRAPRPGWPRRRSRPRAPRAATPPAGRDRLSSASTTCRTATGAAYSPMAGRPALATARPAPPADRLVRDRRGLGAVQERLAGRCAGAGRRRARSGGGRGGAGPASPAARDGARDRRPAAARRAGRLKHTTERELKDVQATLRRLGSGPRPRSRSAPA